MVEKACRYAFDLPTPEAKGKQHERPPDWPKHRINVWKSCRSGEEEEDKYKDRFSEKGCIISQSSD